MILDTLKLTPTELEARTGWALRPEGLCRGDRCVPLPGGAAGNGDTVDLRVVAERLGMPLVGDDEHRVFALGPESGGHVLARAELPPITLRDLDGTPFDLTGLRGQKVVIAAWASW